LPDLDGRVVSLASLRGRVVLLYFWATWCGYCVRELPSTMETLQRRYRDQGLTVLAVSFEERPETVKAWVRPRGLSMPVLLDRAGDVSGNYRVTATPTAGDAWSGARWGRARGRMRGRAGCGTPCSRRPRPAERGGGRRAGGRR